MRRMQNTPTVTTTRLPNPRRLAVVSLEQKIPNLANLARLWQHHSASNVFDNIRGSPLKPLLASCLRGTLVNPSDCATEK